MSAGSFDDLLVLAGGAGRWQLLVLLQSTIQVVLRAVHNLSAVFLATTPRHRCAIPGENVPDSEFLRPWIAGLNASDAGLLQLWIPRDNVTDQWSSCQRWTGGDRAADVGVEFCDAWVFARDEYPSTVVTEWSLVCSRLWMRSTVQAVAMMGVFLGSLFGGIMGDQLGRKRTVCLFSPLYVASSFAASFAPNYSSFLALRLISASTAAAMFGCLFVLCVELVSPRWRASMGLIFHLPYAFGYMLLPLVAFYVRDWSHMQLLISLPCVLTLLYWWTIPESPRWLILAGKYDEGLSELKKAAKRNRKELPEDEEVIRMMKEVRFKELGSNSETRSISTLTKLADALRRMVDLFGSARASRITLACFFNWVVVALVYYGVAFDSASISNSRYLAIFLAGLVEVPGYLLAVPLINRVGRRRGIIACHVVSSAMALLILTLPGDSVWPRLLLGALVKLTATSCFAILYVYTAELYPTSMRSVGVSSCSMVGRFGAIAAPFVTDLLAPVHWTAPSMVFAVSAGAAALVALLLPETLNRPLPETVHDIGMKHRDGKMQQEEVVMTAMDGADI